LSQLAQEARALLGAMVLQLNVESVKEDTLKIGEEGMGNCLGLRAGGQANEISTVFFH